MIISLNAATTSVVVPITIKGQTVSLLYNPTITKQALSIIYNGIMLLCVGLIIIGVIYLLNRGFKLSRTMIILLSIMCLFCSVGICMVLYGIIFYYLGSILANGILFLIDQIQQGVSNIENGLQQLRIFLIYTKTKLDYNIKSIDNFVTDIVNSMEQFLITREQYLHNQINTLNGIPIDSITQQPNSNTFDIKSGNTTTSINIPNQYYEITDFLLSMGKSSILFLFSQYASMFNDIIAMLKSYQLQNPTIIIDYKNSESIINSIFSLSRDHLADFFKYCKFTLTSLQKYI